MSPKQLVDAVYAGRFDDAIIEAWLRAGDAKFIAEFAIVVALTALVLSVIAFIGAFRGNHSSEYISQNIERSYRSPQAGNPLDQPNPLDVNLTAERLGRTRGEMEQ